MTVRFTALMHQFVDSASTARCQVDTTAHGAVPGVSCNSLLPKGLKLLMDASDPADEIDAIGKARGSGSGDAGTQEREQGLMQMLYEMDGFASNDGVLVVGATNRVNLLDDALLRKGRFDMTIYMGRPSTNNRFKILQVRLQRWSGKHQPAAALPEHATCI